MILNDIKKITSTPAELKKFGVTVGSVFLLLGGVMFFLHGKHALLFLSAGIVLLLLGATFPKVLLPLHKLWMSLGIVLGFFSTRLILGLLFYVVFTPIRIINKLAGKKLLDLRIEPEAETYWQKRPVRKFEKAEYEKQF